MSKIGKLRQRLADSNDDYEDPKDPYGLKKEKKLKEEAEANIRPRERSPWDNYDEMIADGISHDEALATSGLSPEFLINELKTGGFDQPDLVWEYGLPTLDDLKKNPKHKGYKKVPTKNKIEINPEGETQIVKPDFKTKIVEKPPIDNPNEVKDPKFDERGRYIKKRKRLGKLRQRIAQVRLAADYSMESWKSFGPDMDAVKAFINKRTYKSGKGAVDRKTGTKQGNYKFRTDGRTLFVWDSPVVKHSKDGGYDVSGANYNTPLTMSTINAVGIHAREGRYDPEGRNRIALGSEFLQSNDPTWVHISPDEVQSKPVIYEDRVGGGKKRGTSGVSVVKRPNQAEFSSATIARERGEAGRERGNPPSKTNIQPTKRDKFGDSQEQIDEMTGLKTKTPRETLGVKAHHLLDYAGKGKALPKEHGGIMLPDDYHDFITRFQKGSPKGNLRRLRQVSSKLRLKIARIRMAAAAPGISMNPQHGRTIADAFDTMQHTPNSPKVKASYNAFINETNDQARALQKSGVKFESLRKRQPYGKRGGIA